MDVLVSRRVIYERANSGKRVSWHREAGTTGIFASPLPAEIIRAAHVYAKLYYVFSTASEVVRSEGGQGRCWYSTLVPGIRTSITVCWREHTR